jgi:hypothetical protein
MVGATAMAERTGEVVETMANLARTFTADEIEEFVEEKILELSVLMRNLARAGSRRSSSPKPTDPVQKAAVALNPSSV